MRHSPRPHSAYGLARAEPERKFLARSGHVIPGIGAPRIPLLVVFTSQERSRDDENQRSSSEWS